MVGHNSTIAQYYISLLSGKIRNPNMNNKDLEGLEEGLMMSGGNEKVEESGLKPNQHLIPG